MPTVFVIHWVSASFWHEKRSVLHQQSKHAGATRPTSQPDYKRVGGWVTATLKEPVEKVHSMSVVDLL